MPKKYHINVAATPLNLKYISKFIIERGDNCINCGKCTKVCIYEAHKRGPEDPRKMADPNTVACRNCFRCIQECPRGALVKSLDRDFFDCGGTYWKPDMLLTLWKQAEDGKVPVSGAGYRGPFTGSGFDSMWTDMSEIVRPTRDGIHGREYISTSVDLGRRLNHLSFDNNGQLSSRIHPTVDLPLPIVFDAVALNVPAAINNVLARAARVLTTCAILPAHKITPALAEYAGSIIPLLALNELDQHQQLIRHARLVAIEYEGSLLNYFQSVRDSIRKLSGAVTIVRVPATDGIEEIVSGLAHAGAEVVHIVADYRGMNTGGARFIKDVVQSVHLRLVEERLRDEITIIASGGIAMAEHVPKTMICGADLTAVDLPLLIGLGARLYEDPLMSVVLPEGLETAPAAALTQRIVNLMGAWHSQLLEVMGAMGIREARRLRGETGRAIFFDEIEKETFGKIFQKKEAASL